MAMFEPEAILKPPLLEDFSRSIEPETTFKLPLLEDVSHSMEPIGASKLPASMPKAVYNNIITIIISAIIFITIISLYEVMRSLVTIALAAVTDIDSVGTAISGLWATLIFGILCIGIVFLTIPKLVTLLKS